jgi:hypothetical protein
MKPTAPERFAVKAVVAAAGLILAMTAQALAANTRIGMREKGEGSWIII